MRLKENLTDEKVKLSNTIKATYYCDFENSVIDEVSDRFVSLEVDTIDMVKQVFTFVQNNIRFGMDFVNVKASETLEKGYGACWNKALLLVTLLRKLNIPARVVCDPLKNDFSKPCFGLISYLSNNPFYHGLVQVYINDKWIRIDPTLDNNTFNKCFKPLDIKWINEWDGSTDMKIYSESVIGETIVIEDIDERYSKNFGNSIPPQFIINYMNKKLWKKAGNL